MKIIPGERGFEEAQTTLSSTAERETIAEVSKDSLTRVIEQKQSALHGMEVDVLATQQEERQMPSKQEQVEKVAAQEAASQLPPEEQLATERQDSARPKQPVEKVVAAPATPNPMSKVWTIQLNSRSTAYKRLAADRDASKRLAGQQQEIAAQAELE